jgi:energy-coupling factor transporter ATP-binding protein EcfA2
LGGTHWTETYKYVVDKDYYLNNTSQVRTVDNNATSYWNVFAVTPYENRIAYDNDGIVKYIGAFGQLEYTNDDNTLNWFVAGSFSTTDNTRVDRYNYRDILDRQTSETVSINGYNAKAGLNYNVTDKSNLYANVGKYSRAPFFAFLFQDYVNTVADNVVNEEVDALELGYGYKSKNIALKINAYSTKWGNKTLLSGRIPTASGGTTRALIQGIGAHHKGVEVEFNSSLSDTFKLGGIASLGDWKWTGDVAYELRSDIDQSITKGYAYTDGLPVGNAPQTQIGAKARWQATDKLDLGATYVYNDRLYANYDPTDYQSASEKSDPYMLDAYGMLDLRAGLKTGRGYLQLQINNALNYDGFIEAVNNSDGSDISYGFPSWGTNMNLSYKFSF